MGSKGERRADKRAALDPEAERRRERELRAQAQIRAEERAGAGGDGGWGPPPPWWLKEQERKKKKKEEYKKRGLELKCKESLLPSRGDRVGDPYTKQKMKKHKPAMKPPAKPSSSKGTAAKPIPV